MTKTVLITGANGFVAWYLIRDLLQEDYKIVATGKSASRLPFNDPKLVYETLDITDAGSVKTVFEKHKPDIVVHAAALSKPDECELNREAAFLTNVQATEFLLQAAAVYHSYFLFISTDFVFAGTRLNYKEDDAVAPVNYYGQTKKEAEEAVQKYPFEWGIVRTILVYGKPMSGRQNILTIVAGCLQKGEPYRVFSDQTRMPTYVEDLARALATMIAKQSTGIFHIAGADVLTPYQMALAVANQLGYAAHGINEVTAETFRQPALRPPITGFDLTKATAELAYTPTPFSEGLRKTVETWGFEKDAGREKVPG